MKIKTTTKLISSILLIFVFMFGLMVSNAESAAVSGAITKKDHYSFAFRAGYA